jgi:hypothetical protein
MRCHGGRRRFETARLLSAGLHLAALVLLFIGVIGALVGGIVLGSQPTVPWWRAALIAGGCGLAVLLVASVVAAAGWALRVTLATYDVASAVSAALSAALSAAEPASGPPPDPRTTGLVPVVDRERTSPDPWPLPPGVVRLATVPASARAAEAAPETPSGRLHRRAARRPVLSG